MNFKNRKRYLVQYDEDNYRFIFLPYNEGDQVTPGSLLRIIHKWIQGRSKYNLKWMSEFLGLKNASEVFKATYAVAYCPRKHPELEELVAIDTTKHEVYLYHHKHKPANVTKPHVGPTLENGEDEVQELANGVPTKICTRVTVVDSVQRMLTMTLKPTGGYLLGLRDVSLGQPNMTYQVVGSAKSLNNILRSLQFVGVEAGNGSLSITIDDGAGDVSSTASTLVNVVIGAADAVSVVTLNIPNGPTVMYDKYSEFEAITVDDPDGRVCELRITPFGCHVAGFASYAGYLVPGQKRTIYGTPDQINTDIAGLQVRALQENAQLGIELICGKTKILNYLLFAVDMTGEDDGRADSAYADQSTTDNDGEDTIGGGSNDPTDPNAPGEPVPDPVNPVEPTDPTDPTDPVDPTDPNGDSGDGGTPVEPTDPNIEHPEQPTYPGPSPDDVEMVYAGPNSGELVVSDDNNRVPLDVSFSGSRITRTPVIIGGTNVKFTSGTTTTEHGIEVSLENNIPTLNTKISDIRVELIDASANGTVTVAYIGDNNVERMAVIAVVRQ